MGPEIRPLTVDDDLATFGRLVVDAYQAVPGHPFDRDYDVELADVAARVRDGVVFAAFGPRGPLGCVTYVNDPSCVGAESLAENEASFRMLAVAAAAQQQGVGAALVVRCLDEARANGRAAMFIYSGDWMTAAHRLYRRLGFVRVPDRDWSLPERHIELLGFRREI